MYSYIIFCSGSRLKRTSSNSQTSRDELILWLGFLTNRAELARYLYPMFGSVFLASMIHKNVVCLFCMNSCCMSSKLLNKLKILLIDTNYMLKLINRHQLHFNDTNYMLIVLILSILFLFKWSRARKPSFSSLHY
jgi:hypothetical protein